MILHSYFPFFAVKIKPQDFDKKLQFCTKYDKAWHDMAKKREFLGALYGKGFYEKTKIWEN